MEGFDFDFVPHADDCDCDDCVSDGVYLAREMLREISIPVPTFDSFDSAVVSITTVFNG